MRSDFDEKKNDYMSEDNDISERLTAEENIPDIVLQARDRAFQKIKQMEQTDHKKAQKTVCFSGMVKGVAAAAACVVVLSGVVIANPVLASQIPVIGSLFKQLNDVISFKSDFDEYAQPLTEALTEVVSETTVVKATTEDQTENESQYFLKQTDNGTTITLSECYSNDSVLYLSLAVESEEPLPDDLTKSDRQTIAIPESMISFSFSEQAQWLYDFYIQGKCLDDHTFIGVIRCELDPYLTGYSKEGEMTRAELPENYEVSLEIPQLVMDRMTSLERPPMPEEIQEEYDDAMNYHGLSTNPDDWVNFTEEEEEIANSLWMEKERAYNELYPGCYGYPNPYENIVYEGNWNFHFQASVNDSETIIKEIQAQEEAEGIGKVVIEKTPFEIMVKCDGERAYDYFCVVFDANGNKMEYGGSGNSDTYPIGDADVSKVTVYICDEIEYFDELKGYYYSDDYEEKAKEKTFMQLLDERCLYSEEIVF